MPVWQNLQNDSIFPLKGTEVAVFGVAYRRNFDGRGDFKDMGFLRNNINNQKSA
jgi:hypothetical protein